MTAFYKIVETPNPRKDGEKLPYHVRYAAVRTIKSEALIDQIRHHSSFSPSDIKGILTLFQEALILNLTNGCNVELEGLGTFTLSVKCPPETDKAKINTSNVKFRNVKFRTSGKLKKRLEHTKFYRKEKKKEIPTLTQEQRKNILIKLIRKNKFTTAKTYRLHTGVSKAKAAQDIKQFIQEKLIISCGKGPTTFYMFRE